MFCPACGMSLAPSARFCGGCGQAMAPAPNEAPAPALPPRTRGGPRPSFNEPAQDTTAVIEPTKPAPAPRPPRGPRGSGPKWTRIGAIAGALALMAVIGVIAFRAFTGATGGAGSPEAAVRNLADAVSKEDAPAALTLLPPGEVRSLKSVFEKATSKASKAGLVRAANPFGGFDLTITDLRLDVQKLAKDVSKVTVQAGRIGYAVDEKAALTPVQSVLAQAREDADGGAGWGKGEVSLAPTRDRTALVLMTVRQNGRWYVSPTYTALETWRENSGLPGANFSLDLSKVTTGSKSPEGAFNDFSAAVQAFDSNRLIDLLSPDELGGAARRYRQAIQVGTGEFFSDLKSEVTFRVNDSHPVVQNKHGGSAEVAISSASGVTSSGGDSARWSLEGTCLNVISSGDRSNQCRAELDAESGVSELANATPNFFVSITSYHGRWYISPVQTVLRYVQLMVDKLTDRQVLAMFDLRQFAKPDGALAAGASVKGTLNRGQYGVYTFDVATPGPVLACTNGGSADTNVSAYVYRPSGRPADEVTGGIYIADQGGSYRVVLRSYESSRPEAFDVAVKPLPFQDVNVPGDATGSVGTGCDGKLLRFNATAGDHVLIQGRLPGGSPTVYDAKGNYYASGRVFTPRQTGSYLVAITDPGDYSVHLERATGNFLTQSESLQGSVVARGTAEYQLYASAGDRLRISARGSGTFDGTMTLLSPSGATLSSADDTNGKDPAITYSFTTEGIYKVRVSGYQGQAGSFTVSVS